MKFNILPAFGRMIVILLLASGATNSHARKAAVIDSLEHSLAHNTTAADSILTLYHISDLTAKNESYDAFERIYHIAKRTGNSSVALDALRQMSRLSPRNDSIKTIIIRRIHSMPDSPERRETETFARLQSRQYNVPYMTRDERTDALHSALKSYNNTDSVDIYNRIEQLFTICLLLRDTSHSQMLNEYLTEMRNLIETLPTEPGALRNLYYNSASMAYSSTTMRKEAIRSDSTLLAIVNDLEAKYHREKRIFRDFSTYRYTVYQRMLGNYQVLTPQQIDEYYHNVLELASQNASIDHDMRQRSLTNAYYLMATKQYAKAVPMLQNALKSGKNNRYRTKLLQMLVEASRASNNRQALFDAYEQYVPLLEYRNDSIDDDYVMQYRVLLDFKNLQDENRSLDAENDRLELEGQRKLIIFGCIIVLLITILAVLFLVAWRRSRAMAQRLSDSNRDLLYERDKMRRTQADLIRARDDAQVAERQKSDFINTISHEVSEPINAIVGYSQIIIDSLDDKRRQNMERFIKIIEVNALLLRTLVNDVLDVAELENSQVLLKRQRVSMASLAQVAADSMLPLLKPGVTMTCEPLTEADAKKTVDVDPARLEQILGNLVSNAVKFTEQGCIRIKYGLSKSTGKPVFIVEDTGPGIPADKHQVIFNRFEKLSSSSQGIGLGLYICRVVARVLDATVEVDPDYTDGTRMIITLPED